MSGVVYRKHLSEPWYSLVYDGIKTVEGRLNVGDFGKMCVGDCVEFWNNECEVGRKQKFVVRIERIAEYATFKDYLVGEGLKKCLPVIDNIDKGVATYHKYYSPEDETKFGVKAFGIRKI